MRTIAAAVGLAAAALCAWIVVRECGGEASGPDPEPSRIERLAAAERARARAARTRTGTDAAQGAVPGETAPEESPASKHPPEPNSVAAETVEVLVLDEDGSPAAGATATVIHEGIRQHYRGWNVGAVGVTGADGRVALPVGASLAFLVRAVRDERVGTSGWMQSRDAAGARRAATVRLARGVRLCGVVTDADTGDPVPGARIGLFHGTWMQSVVAGDDGSFVSEAYDEEDLLRDPWPPDDEPRISADGYAHDSVTSRREGGVLRVTISRATSFRLRLVRPDGRPVPGCHVTVRCENESPSRTGQDSGETGADGRIDVSLLADPGARVEVWPEDGQVAWFPGAAERVRERDLGDVVLRETGTVTGIVVDERGEPAHQAYVWIESAAGGPRLDGDTTDLDGLFELEHVGDGDHVLLVHPHGRHDDVTRRTGVRAGDRDLRVVLPRAAGTAPESR